ncbi:MAG TPA: DUF4465 domain-containing protein [Bacteroidia bacterium]|jgi:hypothetical protein|nr:DUF4465 domain-containing protein [Bacteroidia bacterium]
MTKSLLTIALISFAFFGKAQTTFISDFETVMLPDYKNEVYNDSTNGVGGFKNGHAFFQTGWAGFWSSGWVASSVHDSSTAGYANQYGCAGYKGYNNSNVFAIGTIYGRLTIRMTDSLIGKTVSGFYVNNSTYAYKSMKNGDSFAKKFGDTTGTHCGCAQGSYPDWFKLTVKRYYSGVLQNDSVEVYLGDYRFSNNAQDYILKNWTWINLSALGNTDSLAFFLHSSDNGTYGMNTPAFFCVDNLTLNMITGIQNYYSEEGLNIFPNPAANETEISFITDASVYVSMKVTDVTGREMASQNMSSFTGQNKFKIDVSQFPAGVYYVTLNANGKMLTKKLIK